MRIGAFYCNYAGGKSPDGIPEMTQSSVLFNHCKVKGRGPITGEDTK
jgi:hypothetical protein